MRERVDRALRGRCPIRDGAATFLLLVAAAVALGQQPPAPSPQPTTPGQPPVAPAPEEPGPARAPEEPLPGRGPFAVAPPAFLGPDFFNPSPQPGWLTLTPSVTISEEYNDNVFLLGGDRTSDLITSVTPGVTLGIQRPEHRLTAGYNFTAEAFARERELNSPAKRHQLFTDASYRFGPRVTLTIAERFIFDRESNVVTAGGLSAGRQETWRNSLTPAVQWQATPLTSLRLSALYTIQRFQRVSQSDVRNSDTYDLSFGVDHQITRRLTGTANLEFAYLKAGGEPPASTPTARLGFGFRITPTLQGSLSGGPTAVVRRGNTNVTPAVTGGLQQRFRFGSLGIGYDRSVVADTIGVTDHQTVFASLQVTTRQQGLRLEFTPRYTIADEQVSNGRGRRLRAVAPNLRANCRIARSVSLIGSYTFFHQGSDLPGDHVDQNRVFIGIQLAHPISFH